jgi:hypothetical protein
MLIFLNIVYAAFLFCIFVLLLSLPFALIVWAVRRWYATHRLAELPWRKRRALLGWALLWNAVFSKLSLWKKIAGISAILSILLIVFLALLRATVCSWTMEDSIIRDLQIARYSWLQDDCPRPADPRKYLPQSSSFTGSVYTVSLVAKDPDLEKRSLGMFKDRTCRGLFAIKEYSSQNTYVIATSGEILLLDSRGGVQLLRAQ